MKASGQKEFKFCRLLSSIIGSPAKKPVICLKIFHRPSRLVEMRYMPSFVPCLSPALPYSLLFFGGVKKIAWCSESLRRLQRLLTIARPAAVGCLGIVSFMWHCPSWIVRWALAPQVFVVCLAAVLGSSGQARVTVALACGSVPARTRAAWAGGAKGSAFGRRAGGVVSLVGPVRGRVGLPHERGVIAGSPSNFSFHRTPVQRLWLFGNASSRRR
jgi:hypothetical protein